MAVSYTWPITLPKSPQKGYKESLGANIVRTPMDAGIAKQRRRSASPDILSVQYLMTTAQVAIFDDFVANSLRGIRRFGYIHPRKLTTVEARIIPQGGGNLYNTSYLAPGYYTIDFQLEILP